MSSTYDTDIVIWSEQQSELLRHVAAGEVPNVAPDWQNIIEEVETLGKAGKSFTPSMRQRIRLTKIHHAGSPAGG